MKWLKLIRIFYTEASFIASATLLSVDYCLASKDGLIVSAKRIFDGTVRRKQARQHNKNRTTLV